MSESQPGLCYDNNKNTLKYEPYMAVCWGEHVKTEVFSQ